MFCISYAFVKSYNSIFTEITFQTSVVFVFQYHEEISRFTLLSRARTEHKITMRKRGPMPPPRSALTAPTTGLPFLTTRPSTTKTEVESYSNLVKLNELKRLKFHLEVKCSKPGRHPQIILTSLLDGCVKRQFVPSVRSPHFKKAIIRPNY